MARPTDYREEFCEEAKQLCENGATDIEVAKSLDINVATLYRWKARHPKFSEALKVGKAVADTRVERSLYHKAVGYSYEAEKIFQFQGQIVRAETIEHVPPDTTAGIFWLKNRKPAEWREKHEHELSGSVEAADPRQLARTILEMLRETGTKP